MREIGIASPGPLEGERQFCKGGQRESSGRGRDGMRRRIAVVPSLATVGLGRVLNCLQVVCHRNDREQDQQEHGQGDKLHPPAAAGARGNSQPKEKHEGGKQNPGEIEDQLHSQC